MHFGDNYPQPFYLGRCDAVGPMASTIRGNQYILVAVDYLTRWPIALAVKAIDRVTTADFLYRQSMCQHGLPQYILTDRGSNLSSTYVNDFLRVMQVKHLTTTAFQPQTNGLCERMNGTILKRRPAATRSTDNALFFLIDWICNYGLPEKIILDRGPHFDNSGKAESQK